MEFGGLRRIGRHRAGTIATGRHTFLRGLTGHPSLCNASVVGRKAAGGLMTKALMRVKTRIEGRVKHSKSLIERMGMSVEQYERVALNMLLRMPALGECEPDSVDQAVLQCIETGLVPDGREAAVIPFKKRATLIPMIAGRLKLARQATPGLSVRARVVYEDDAVRAQRGHRGGAPAQAEPGRRQEPGQGDRGLRDRAGAEGRRARVGGAVPERAGPLPEAFARAERRAVDERLRGDVREDGAREQVLKRLAWRAAPSAMAIRQHEDDLATVGYDAEVQEEAEEPEQRGEVVVVEPERSRTPEDEPPAG